MKNSKLTFVVVCVAGLLCALSAYFFSSSGKSDPKGVGPSKVERGKKFTKKYPVARRRLRPDGKLRVDGNDTHAEKTGRVKPTFELDADEEAQLNEEQRRTIAAIRAALDEDSRKTIVKLVQKLQASDEWPDGIPKSIKMAAIEALGWFGSSCLPELSGFLGDADAEVVQSAIDKYSEMIGDVELSDYERAEILIAASQVINDAEAMDTMLFELNNMRHSVAAETMKTIMQVGTEATKEVLPANIEFVTCEEGITTPEQIDKWLEENPDDEGDDEFYGTAKPSDT